MAITATYDAGQVIVTVDGIRIEGAADGAFVSVEQSNPRYNKSAGVDGASYRSRQNDRTGTVTVSLQYGTPGWVVLNGYKRLGDDGADDKFSLVISEVLSGARMVAEQAWVEAEPTVAYDRDIGTGDWVLGFGSIDIEPKVLP
jgi:hypothetical protein